MSFVYVLKIHKGSRWKHRVKIRYINAKNWKTRLTNRFFSPVLIRSVDDVKMSLRLSDKSFEFKGEIFEKAFVYHTLFEDDDNFCVEERTEAKQNPINDANIVIRIEREDWIDRQ